MMRVVAVTARPTSLTDLVLERIRVAIVSKDIPPGSVVSEGALATQLEVSKTPVRESLIRLTEIGLVESIGGRLRVIEPSGKKLRDAYDLRIALEPSATALAALRVEPGGALDLIGEAEANLAIARTDDAAQHSQVSRGFHTHVAELTDNPHLERAIGNGLVLVQALRQRDASKTHRRLESAEYHLSIAKAIAAGDAETAARDMRAHLESLMAEARESYGSDAADEWPLP